MNGIISILNRLIIKPTPLFLKDFKKTRYDLDLKPRHERFWCFPNDKLGWVFIEYFNKNDQSIAYILHNTSNGQIGLFFIEKEYQYRGLGTQILEKATNELRDKKCEEVWAVTIENHPFWSNVNNKSFTYRYPAHPSVTGHGYFRKL